MGLDDFKSTGSDIVPVQELQKNQPPSGYDSWSEYEPEPREWDENLIWAIGDCDDQGLKGDEVLVIADNDNKDTIIKSVEFSDVIDWQ